MRNILAAAAVGCLLLAGCGSALTPHVSGSGTAAPNGSPSGAPTGPAPCGANSSEPNSASATLSDIQFVSPTYGWVVGKHVILATSDGGADWAVQERGNLDLTSVDFIDGQTGWAAGSGSLLVTHDAGQRWTALPEPCPLIRSVHFVSARLGFAIAGGRIVADSAPDTGGVLFATDNGGRSWQRLSAAPPNAQTVCFSTPSSGWLGASGQLYSSTDGGRTWVKRAPGLTVPHGPPAIMSVQCAAGSAWAVNVALTAALGNMPHWGYHADAAAAVPIFAEQYFPHRGVTIKAHSPGPYPGPLSAISSATAVFIGNCPACGEGTAPWDLATNGGKTLVHQGIVGGINSPVAASFVSSSAGWVIGQVFGSQKARIVHTSDGGRNWQVQFSGS